MVGVLSSLPPNPKVDTVKSKVQQIYQPIWFACTPKQQQQQQQKYFSEWE
jgi:hypothetical protein